MHLVRWGGQDSDCLGAVKIAYPHTEEACNRKQGATKKSNRELKVQPSTQASLDDDQELPLDLCLDLLVHMDTLKGVQDRPTVDSSLSIEESLDSVSSGESDSFKVLHAPHLSIPSSPRHLPSVEVLAASPLAY